jgi:hypothetical protein
MSFARMCRGSSLELFRSYTVRIGYTAVSVDRRTLEIDPFRERNSVLFQSNEKYKNPSIKGGFCVYASREPPLQPSSVRKTNGTHRDSAVDRGFD